MGEIPEKTNVDATVTSEIINDVINRGAVQVAEKMAVAYVPLLGGWPISMFFILFLG